jgi:hypothetical protein
MSNARPFPVASAVRGHLIPPHSRFTERGDKDGESQLPVEPNVRHLCVKPQTGGRR